MTPPRVLIADTSAAFRNGVRLTLEGHGFHVCGEAASAREAIELAFITRPDICVLDVDLPGGGIAAAAEITSRLPDAAVVMLALESDDARLFSALRAGASGYLLKTMSPERLPSALRGVLRGEAAVPRVLMARVLESFRADPRRRRIPLVGRRPAELTPREFEVLELLRDGLSTAEIAERLVVEPVTVRTHVAAVMRKLGVFDRVAVVRLLEDEDLAEAGR